MLPLSERDSFHLLKQAKKIAKFLWGVKKCVCVRVRECVCVHVALWCIAVHFMVYFFVLGMSLIPHHPQRMLNVELRLLNLKYISSYQEIQFGDIWRLLSLERFYIDFEIFESLKILEYEFIWLKILFRFGDIWIWIKELLNYKFGEICLMLFGSV